jgi:hypothetical protein
VHQYPIKDDWDELAVFTAIADIYAIVSASASARRFLRRKQIESARNEAKKSATAIRQAREDAVRAVAAEKKLRLKAGDKYLATHFLSAVNGRLVEKELEPMTARNLRDLVSEMKIADKL